MKMGKQRYAIRRRILVQTAGAEVYEVAAASGAATLIAEGHYTGEAWALATNPADSELFATAGDDATVRVWSVSADKLARKAALDAPVRCLAWAPDGATLLAGLGGNVSGARHPKDGTFVLLDVATLRVRAEGRDSRHWIRCAAFSPTGDAFALGSSDQKVYIYDSATARLRARCLAHNAPVAQLDWSLDGRHVQSDATDGAASARSYIKTPAAHLICFFPSIGFQGA
jgi:WD40 repeat protein